jgi:hypothetical protein
VICISITETISVQNGVFEIEVCKDEVVIREVEDDGTKKIVLMLEPHAMDTLCAAIREALATRQTVEKLAEEVKP